MAIGFAKISYISRSKNSNLLENSAYISRGVRIDQKSFKIFDYSDKFDCAFSKVLIPLYVDRKYLNPSILWNKAQAEEKRVNSLLGKELILSLPDEDCISLLMKIEMIEHFINDHFIKYGYAAEYAIHKPPRNDFRNWHAHILISKRKFDKSGQYFEKNFSKNSNIEYLNKLTDPSWGDLWSRFQEMYFKIQGLGLSVDLNGIVSRKKLGPIKKGVRAIEIMKEYDKDGVLQDISKDPINILKHLLKKDSVFTLEQFERYINKNVYSKYHNELRKKFWSQKSIIELKAKSNNKYPDQTRNNKDFSKRLFSAIWVQEEEQIIERIADRIHSKSGIAIRNYYYGSKELENISKKYSLTKNQNRVFYEVILGGRLNIIEGKAGTGKTHLLKAIKEAYEIKGYIVRGFAPTSSAASCLEEIGIKKSMNLHRFLYLCKADKEYLNRKSIVIIDESSMVENKIFLEMLRLCWKKNAQVILVGDQGQLPSVNRGGMFGYLSSKYGASLLHDVIRQKKDWQKRISSNLANNEIHKALYELDKNKKIFWSYSKDQSIRQLIEKWAYDRKIYPGQSQLIMEYRNSYIKIINELARDVRKARGEISNEEYRCNTNSGIIYVSKGDIIQFKENNIKMGVINGSFGEIIDINAGEFQILVDNKNIVNFDFNKYGAWNLGYAGTIHKSQGKTIDRAYLLHSKYMSRNLAYVGLTRQKLDINYFVSREDARNINELCIQIRKENKKNTILDFEIAGTVSHNSNISPLNKSYIHKTYDNFTSKYQKIVNWFKDSFYHNSDLYKQDFNHNKFRQYSAYMVNDVEELKSSYDLILYGGIGKKTELKKEFFKDINDSIKFIENFEKDIRDKMLVSDFKINKFHLYCSKVSSNIDILYNEILSDYSTLENNKTLNNNVKNFFKSLLDKSIKIATQEKYENSDTINNEFQENILEIDIKKVREEIIDNIKLNTKIRAKNLGIEYKIINGSYPQKSGKNFNEILYRSIYENIRYSLWEIDAKDELIDKLNDSKKWLFKDGYKNSKLSKDYKASVKDFDKTQNSYIKYKARFYSNVEGKVFIENFKKIESNKISESELAILAKNLISQKSKYEEYEYNNNKYVKKAFIYDTEIAKNMAKEIAKYKLCNNPGSVKSIKNRIDLIGVIASYQKDLKKEYIETSKNDLQNIYSNIVEYDLKSNKQSESKKEIANKKNIVKEISREYFHLLTKISCEVLKSDFSYEFVMHSVLMDESFLGKAMHAKEYISRLQDKTNSGKLLIEKNIISDIKSNAFDNINLKEDLKLLKENVNEIMKEKNNNKEKSLALN